MEDIIITKELQAYATSDATLLLDRVIADEKAMVERLMASAKDYIGERSMTFEVNDLIVGTDISVWVKVTESKGGLIFSITEGGAKLTEDGDLRAFYANLADTKLIGTLKVSPLSAGLTSVAQGADSVTSVGDKDTTMSGTKTSFDFGAEIGTQGAGKDFYTSFSFRLDSGARPLSLKDVAGQAMGVRVTSDGANGDGSSKLVETTMDRVFDATNAVVSISDTTVQKGFTGDLLVDARAALAGTSTLRIDTWQLRDGVVHKAGETAIFDKATATTITVRADGTYDLAGSGAASLSEGEIIGQNLTYFATATELKDATSFVTDSATATILMKGTNQAETINKASYLVTEGKNAVFDLKQNIVGDRYDTLSIGNSRITAKLVDADGRVVEKTPYNLNDFFMIDKAGMLHVSAEKASWVPAGYHVLATIDYIAADQTGTKSINLGTATVDLVGVNTNPTVSGAIATQENVISTGSLAIEDADLMDNAVFDKVTVAAKLLDAETMIKTDREDLASLQANYDKRSSAISEKIGYYTKVVESDKAAFGDAQMKYADAAKPLNGEISKLNEQLAVYDQKLRDAGYYKQLDALTAKYDPMIAGLRASLDYATVDQNWEAVKKIQSQLDMATADFAKNMEGLRGHYADIFSAIGKVSIQITGDQAKLAELYTGIVSKAEAAYNDDIVVINRLHTDLVNLKQDFATHWTHLTDQIAAFEKGDTVDLYAGQNILFKVGASLTFDAAGNWTSDTTAMHSFAQDERFAADLTVGVVDRAGGSASSIISFTADGINDKPVAEVITGRISEGFTSGNISQFTTGATDPDHNAIISLATIGGVAVTSDILVKLDTTTTIVHPANLINQLEGLVTSAFRILEGSDGVFDQKMMDYISSFHHDLIAGLEKMAEAMGSVDGMTIAQQREIFTKLGGLQAFADAQTKLFEISALSEPLAAAETKLFQNFKLQDTYTTTETVRGHLDINLDGAIMSIDSSGNYTVHMLPDAVSGLISHDLVIPFAVHDEFGAIGEGAATYINNNTPGAGNDLVSVGWSTGFRGHLNIFTGNALDGTGRDYDANGDVVILDSLNGNKTDCMSDMATPQPATGDVWTGSTNTLVTGDQITTQDLVISSGDRQMLTTNDGFSYDKLAYNGDGFHIYLGGDDMTRTAGCWDYITTAAGTRIAVDGMTGNTIVDGSAVALSATNWVITFPTKNVYLAPADVTYDADGNPIFTQASLSEVTTMSSETTRYASSWNLADNSKIYDYFASLGLKWDGHDTLTDSFTYKVADNFGGVSNEAIVNINYSLSDLMAQAQQAREYVPTYANLTDLNHDAALAMIMTPTQDLA